MTWREFRFDRKGSSLVWKIIQEGDLFRTEHGILGGAMQQFMDRPGDKGKPGTKAYVNAVDNCNFHVEREIRFKIEHGYIEHVNGLPTSEQVNEINFDKAIPKNLSIFKPQTDIEPKALEKLHKSGKARYSRKIDGMAHIAAFHKGGWEIYTRRMDLTSERFPEHIKALEQTDFEPGTLIIGEMVCLKSGKEDFKAISRICRSLPEQARKIVQDKEVPEATFVIYDIIFHNGKDLKDTCYDDRAKLWKQFKPMEQSKGELIASVDYYDVGPDTWAEKAKINSWEGFVVVGGASIPGERFYNFTGSPKRPLGHHKLKPTLEDDVVIFAVAPGSGKRLGGIGAVHVKQIHPTTGKWMYLGKCGSGFTDNDLLVLEKLCQEKGIPILEKDKDAEKMDINNNNGIVCQLEFGERQPGTQKFRFPVFCRIRTDKAVSECVAQKLAAEEE